MIATFASSGYCGATKSAFLMGGIKPRLIPQRLVAAAAGNWQVAAIDDAYYFWKYTHDAVDSSTSANSTPPSFRHTWTIEERARFAARRAAGR